MEYNADKPLLRVVGFEYFPNPQARLSLVVAVSPPESDQQKNYRRIELHTGKKDRRAAEVANFAKFIIDKTGIKFSRSLIKDSIINKVLGM
ncbi:hypothetical protein PpBr36_02312 [Pyricularia pennisetigena]|uniref:hypothetical protein n=1 Tax=Pyricularia pennisetigena TaxID=1578925 RepID=UPI001153848E|nr:hypothetical protein PpBr36_02312 [Pyricularia pennisetigena]TLS31208.1 hypothetical protein PpBr36_02312 [Pyricularia pennisetigena]